MSITFLLQNFQELKKHNVKEVVRVCEPTYKVDELNSEGINVIDLVFDDGTFPPNQVVFILILFLLNNFKLRECDLKIKFSVSIKWILSRIGFTLIIGVVF